MARAALAVLVVVALGSTGAVAGDAKLKKPDLELRAIPRMGFSPVNVFVTGELKGGDDVEEYYCPELEWDWDDGGKSVHEADCPPYEEGTKIERRYTEEHEYKRAGVYTVKLTMRHAGRTFAAQTVRVTVRPGLGDQTRETPNF
jgi:hypothetical protein